MNIVTPCARKFNLPALAIFAALVICAIGVPAWANDEGALATNPILNADDDFDMRHAACIEKITEDPEAAYEDALIWKGDGGGRRAQHCVALALFALGHEDEAAYRLETMAAKVGIGTADMRADLYAEAAGFWMLASEPRKAYDAAHAGLNLSEQHLELRLLRARAYAAMGRWDYAEIDLSSALAFHPGNPEALRYRADSRRRIGDLDNALLDIEAALRSDPTDVESAIVRGQIREDIRLKKDADIEIKADPSAE